MVWQVDQNFGSVEAGDGGGGGTLPLMAPSAGAVGIAGGVIVEPLIAGAEAEGVVVVLGTGVVIVLGAGVVIVLCGEDIPY